MAYELFFFRMFKTRICKKDYWEFVLEHLLSCFERKKFFSTSAFPLKINRIMDDRDIVILSIYFFRRMIWKKNVFLYPQKECNHLSLSCIVSKVKKKSQIWKKVFSPQYPFFQKPPSYIKFFLRWAKKSGEKW